MFIFYIDESGTNLSDKVKKDYFILASVAVHVNDCSRMFDRVSSLKQQIFPYLKPEDWEIRGRNIRQGTAPFKQKNWEERISIFEAIADVLSSREYNLFSVLSNKKQFSVEFTGADWTDQDLYRITFFKLLDELNNFLVVNDTQGFLFLDSRSSHHSSVQDRRLIDAYLEWLSKRREIGRFVELPMFGASNFYSGLQLADFFGYLVNCISTETVKDKVDKALMRPEDSRRHDLLRSFERLKARIVTFVEIP
jgi:hypothetical protein